MRNHFAPPTLLALLTVFSTGAQTISPPAACSLSAQSAERRFEPTDVEFVKDPKALSLDPRIFPDTKDRKLDFSSAEIARVVGVSPLVVEVLDVNRGQPAGGGYWCEITRLFTVDSRLRSILPQLRVNDLVYGTVMASEGGLTKFVLTKTEKIAGSPRYFHENPKDGPCQNRSGTLIVHRSRFENLSVFNDLTIVFSDRRGHVFARQKLGPELLSRLMQSFKDAGFNALPGSKWTVDNSGLPYVTLICGRYQKVRIEDHQAALAPVLHVLDEVRDAALANTYYQLSYKGKAEINIVEWPLRDLAPDQVTQLKPFADDDDKRSKFAKRPIDPRYAAFEQRLPQDFLDKIPQVPPAPGSQVPDAYVRGGSKLYLVTRDRSGPGERAGTLYTLRIQEIKPPADAFVKPSELGFNPGCTNVAGTRSLYWPSDTEVKLGDLPVAGLRVSREEYAQRPFYEKIFDACLGDGFDFIEGNYIYKKVNLTRLEQDAR